MAFTSSEKRQIRSYLGYSGGFRDYNMVLESMMNVVGEEVDEAAYARTLLTQIAAIDINSAVTGSSGTSTAIYGPVKKVDEIEFFDISNANATASPFSDVEFGEVLIERLRALLGVELAGRYFRVGSTHDFFFGPR